jgi:hypothetical protein
MTLSITITYTADKERSVAQLLEALECCAEVDYAVEAQKMPSKDGWNAERENA